MRDAQEPGVQPVVLVEDCVPVHNKRPSTFTRKLLPFKDQLSKGA